MSRAKSGLTRQVGRKAVQSYCREFDEVMTLSETANWLKVPDAEVSKLATFGEIPGQRIGREWRFLRSALTTWLSMRPHVSPSANRPARPRMWSDDHVEPPAPAEAHPEPR